MPRTIAHERMARTTIPMPEPLVKDIDRVILEFPEKAWNRQKFAEEAIREKIDRVRDLKARYRSVF